MSDDLMWRCECCGFSNAVGFERCSICGLPEEHTPDQLEKYKQALPEIRRSQKKSDLLEDLFTASIKSILKRFLRHGRF